MRVLLATDLSRPAELAAKLIRDAAWAAGTVIRIIGVHEPPATGISLPGADDERTTREFGEAIRMVAASLRRPDLGIEHVTATGRAADRILDESARFNADLVVLGSRGRGAIRAALLGSVSAEVVERASCHVLVVRRGELRRVLFAEDGGASTLEASRVLGWPIFSGLPVRVVSSAEVHLPYGALGEDRHGFEKAVRFYLEEALRSRLRAREAATRTAARLVAFGVAATADVREGKPSTAILGAAESFGADLIIVGSKGAGLTNGTIGSIARDVLFNAGCSVLLARPLEVAIGEDGRERAAAMVTH